MDLTQRIRIPVTQTNYNVDGSSTITVEAMSFRPVYDTDGDDWIGSVRGPEMIAVEELIAAVEQEHGWLANGGIPHKRYPRIFVELASMKVLLEWYNTYVRQSVP